MCASVSMYACVAFEDKVLEITLFVSAFGFIINYSVCQSIAVRKESVFRVSARQSDNFPLITMLFNLNFNIKTLCA